MLSCVPFSSRTAVTPIHAGLAPPGDVNRIR